MLPFLLAGLFICCGMFGLHFPSASQGEGMWLASFAVVVFLTDCGAFLCARGCACARIRIDLWPSLSRSKTAALWVVCGCVCSSLRASAAFYFDCFSKIKYFVRKPVSPIIGNCLVWGACVLPWVKLPRWRSLYFD